MVRDQSPIDPHAIEQAFLDQGFVCTGEVATTLYLAERLAKPVLLEGPPGVGKTEIGKLWAAYHAARLIRLQCYEGLDESKALYEWAYGKQMLYTQLLREKTGELLAGATDLRDAIKRLASQTDAFFSREFLLERPLLAAIASPDPVVLLIDEIDRADEEFEAFLLEVLSDYQISIPELGTIRARRPPRVILTSNDSRDLADALRRRCLYLYVDYPGHDDELRIIERRAPALGQTLAQNAVRFAQSLRKAELRKQPGVAEVIDWALALVALGARDLSPRILRETLGALLKNRDDLERVLSEVGRTRR
ncbi:MAG TPA: MoxR family ATPase [Candidatus Polarisedimenticolaceae bacterium]|nr:MoxR family ATPase [Candidatus Polarisedimenticolaceae bacterium]